VFDLRRVRVQLLTYGDVSERKVPIVLQVDANYFITKVVITNRIKRSTNATDTIVMQTWVQTLLVYV